MKRKHEAAPLPEPSNDGWKKHLSDPEQQGLREHQVEGISFMWKCIAIDKKGCILAHEMGLGKTRQILALFQGMAKAEKAKLFTAVLPVGLIKNWEDEAKKWFPVTSVFRYESSQNPEARVKSLEQWKSGGGLLLTSYSRISASLGQIQKKEKDEPKTKEELAFHNILLNATEVVAVDESHIIHNQKSITSLACRAFKTELRVAITGTPLVNSKDDVLTLIDFVRPNYYNTTELQRFLKPVSDSLRAHIPEFEINEIHGRADAFVRATKHIIHRRSAKNINVELPPLNHFICKVRLSPVQASLYTRCTTPDAARKEKGSQTISSLPAVHQITYHPSMLLDRTLEWFEEWPSYVNQYLKWLSPTPNENNKSGWEQLSPKILMAKQIVQEAVKLEERTLIFSTFPDILHNLREYLLGTGVCRSAMVMSGEAQYTPEVRNNIIRSFQKGEIDVLLLTIGVGGVGLTLTAATRVILLEPTWNLAKTQQAVFRAYRLGQTKPVYAYQLVADGTVESSVLLAHMLKKDWVHKRLVENETATTENLAEQAVQSMMSKRSYQPSKALPVEPSILSLDHIMSKLSKLTIDNTTLVISASTHTELLKQVEPELDEYAESRAKRFAHMEKQFSNPNHTGLNAFVGNEGDWIVRAQKMQQKVPFKLGPGGSQPGRGGKGGSGNGVPVTRLSNLDGKTKQKPSRPPPPLPPPRRVDPVKPAPTPVPQHEVDNVATRIFQQSQSHRDVNIVIAEIGRMLINVEDRWVLQGLVFPKLVGDFDRKVLVDFIMWSAIRAGSWRFQNAVATSVTWKTLQDMRGKHGYDQWRADVERFAPAHVKEWVKICDLNDTSFAATLNLSELYEACFPTISSTPQIKNFTAAFREKLGLWEPAIPEWLKILTYVHLRCRHFIVQVFEWGFDEVLSMVLQDYKRGTSILRRIAASMAIPNAEQEFDGAVLKRIIGRILVPQETS